MADEELVPLEKVDLSKLQGTIWQPLVDAKLLTEQGFVISGMGILINKMC